MRHLVSLLFLLTLTSCLHPTRDRYSPNKPYQTPYSGPDLEPGVVLTSGMLGVSMLSEVDRHGGSDPATGEEPRELEQLPLIGGAWQTALGGERFDYGLESGATLGFRSGRGYVRSGGGSLVVAVDIDLLLLDIFGGPFISTHLGEKVRVYGAAGPLMQFGNYSHQGSDGGTEIDEEGTGFGVGWYARTGIEMAVDSRMMIGVGVRWIDSRMTLSNGLGSLDVTGSQIMLSFTTGY